MGRMDWLRRNWPDLLIGIALVAVIAGIIATLISGGSFFPVGQGSRATTPTTQSSGAAAGSANSGSQASPNASTPDASQPAGAAGDASSSTVPATPGSAASDTSPSAPAGTPDRDSAASTPPADAGSIAVLPPDGDDGGATPAASADAPATSTPAASSPAVSTPAASTPAASSAVTPASSVTATATSDEVSYRVSVGAFGSMENAARLAETFRSAGYPVLMGAQGNLNIVLVGPYASEDEARAVAARIRGGDFGVSDPTVYRFDPAEATEGGAATSAAGAAAPTPAASGAGTPQAAAAPASTGGRYLQVGAYGTRESSLPQRERLEQLGFSVSERVENDLVKLLVGPFDTGAMADAQARLEAAGIESFPR